MRTDRLEGNRCASLLPLAIVVLGLALRLRQFVVWRSLWIDEAMLALNVVSRSFADLLQPLDYNQGAPLGFLVLQKFAVLLFGQSDTALRIVPLLASCLAVVLFAGVATSWMGEAGLVAAALFAIATPLVDYSTEAKQYAVDVAVVVLILGALRPWVDGSVRERDWRVVAVVGVLAPWFSHPAAFVLPGAGLVLLMRSFARGRSELVTVAGVTVAGVGVVWLLSFAALYEVSLATLSTNATLTGYWRTSFASLDSPNLGRWTLAMFGAYLRDVVAIGDSGPARLLVAFGAVSLAIRRFDLAVVLCAPLVLALAASANELYPFSGRLLLFAVPTTLLLCAEGLGRAMTIANAIASRSARDGRPWGRVVLAASAMLILWNPARGAWERLRVPRNSEALRPALEYLVSKRTTDELIYVYYGAKPAMAFYSPGLAIPDDSLVLGRAHRADPNAYRDEVRQVTTHPSAWVVFTHNCPNCLVDEWGVILSELDARGRRVDSFETPGAAVYQYRFDPR